METIFLIGMPGVGKSYWGKEVAAYFGLSFLDLDFLIVANEDIPIPEIFATYGEQGFRERERKCLLELIEVVDGGAVVACGGGTPCFYDNIDQMKKAGTVIYLEAKPDFLYYNIVDSDKSRPMLNDDSLVMEQLAKMLANRKPFYEQAHHILQAKDITLATFDKIINHV